MNLFDWMNLNDTLEINYGDKTIKLKDIGRVTYFDKNDESSIATIEAGHLFWKKGGLVDTSNSTSDKEGVLSKGYSMLVIDQDRRIKICDHKKGKIQHTSLTQGEPVFAAGMVQVHNGKIKSYHDDSGHYRCDGEQFSILLSILLSKGVNISEIDFKLRYIDAEEVSKIISNAVNV